jgi:two-component system LytT family response regulator
MRAIIVDDEIANVENLRVLLNKHCPEVDIVADAGDVVTAERLINLHKPNLIFLDIQLHNQTSFDLLKLVPGNSFEVIFVTAFDNYGIQAIKYAALDYLLKPVDIDELIVAVTKAALKIKNKQDDQRLAFLLSSITTNKEQPIKIALPQQKETRYVAVDQIVRCEADNTYTFFYLYSGEKILVSKSLKEYADLLQPNGFLRTHQSHLVNVSYVRSWLKEDGGMLLLENGNKIPVSKPNRDKVRSGLTFLAV